MSRVVKTFRKAVPERRRLYVDYDCWLEDDETLTNFQAVITPYTATAPLVIDLAYTNVTNRQLTMFASGGVANTGYIVDLLINTNEGQVKRDSLGIMVTS